MIRVSVVTVCFNAAACIETALRSVRDQSYPQIEHVIIDGGSTDQTVDIIRHYHGRLGYFVSEPDRGIYHAMNKGVKASTGDILFFLNTDDRFADNQVVADVASVFEQRPGLEVVYGNLLWEMPGGRLVIDKQPPMITRELLARRTVLHQTVFARRELFAGTQSFSEHYRVVSDYEWMLKVFLTARRDYLHLDRHIAIVGTGGRSATLNWELERMRVMIRYFAPHEILIHRILPRQRKSLESSIRKARQRLERLVNGRA